MVKRVFFLAPAISLLLFASLPERAEGGASLALSLGELVERADLIAHARAIASRSQFKGDRIVTEVDLVIERAIADISTRRELRITVPGGVVGGIGMRVEGAPQFTVGEELVLFAAESPRGLRTIGMSQGVFPVERRGGLRVVQPGGRGMALYRRDASGRLMRSGGALSGAVPLSEFIAQIERELEIR